MTNENIKKEREEINKRLQELNVIEKEINIPLQKLAIELHSIHCRWNHTDGCGWFYEICDGSHTWTSASHLGYYKDAEKLAKTFEENNINLEGATNVLRIMNGKK